MKDMAPMLDAMKALLVTLQAEKENVNPDTLRHSIQEILKAVPATGVGTSADDEAMNNGVETSPNVDQGGFGHRLVGKHGPSARTGPYNLPMPQSFAGKNSFTDLQDAYATQKDQDDPSRR